MKWDWIFFDADETLFTFDSFLLISQNGLKKCS